MDRKHIRKLKSLTSDLLNELFEILPSMDILLQLHNRNRFQYGVRNKWIFTLQNCCCCWSS